MFGALRVGIVQYVCGVPEQLVGSERRPALSTSRHRLFRHPERSYCISQFRVYS